MSQLTRVGKVGLISLGMTMILPAAMAENVTISNKEAVPQRNNSQFIAVGKVVQVTFGDFAFKLDFIDDKTMTFIGIGEASQGVTDTVQYTAVEIRSGVYMVYWSEPKSGDNVTHVEDFQRGEVYTNIAGKDGTFTHLKGQLKIVGHSGK
ncbi:MoaF-related domain-containing protein [Serratia quinivorans]|uniref:MoaF-related domain-containing protein n=1 Tax=Serratia quinivorans TaxID=137545 RepID=UPI003F99111E